MQILETARLRIRVDTHEEYVHVFATMDDTAIKSIFGIQTDQDLQSQKAKIAGGLTTYRTSVQFFHLILKETETVIGSVAYHNWQPLMRRSEIGYEIKPEDHKNKGYMKEAFPVILAYGFEHMDLNRIEAYIAPANTPSRKLVEHAGFTLEGLLQEHYLRDGIFTDSVVYGLLLKNYWQ